MTEFSVGQRVQVKPEWPCQETWVAGDRYGEVIRITGSKVHVRLDPPYRSTLRVGPAALLDAERWV